MSEIPCCDCYRLRRTCKTQSDCVRHQYSGFKSFPNSKAYPESKRALKGVKTPTEK